MHINEPYSVIGWLKCLPNDKILDWSKFKAFADDNLNVAKVAIFVTYKEEGIVRIGVHAGYQHFLLFPQCFQKAYFSGSLKKSELYGKSLIQVKKYINPCLWADKSPNFLN